MDALLSKRIEVKISPKGVAKVDMHNFHDGSCAAISDKLKAAVGGGVAAEEVTKPEFYNTTDNQQTVTL